MNNTLAARPFKLTAHMAALLMSVGLAQTAFAADASPVTGKVTLISEYEYRGISQTSQKPAVQLNLDYAHSSGFYAGGFLSNINWIKNTAKELQNVANQGSATVNGQSPIRVSGKGNVELDLFAGYKFEPAKDLLFDVGYLRYEYPGAKAVVATSLTSPLNVTLLKKPNTDEIYGGVTFAGFNVKYSHIVSDAFGAPDSKNSYFIEANYSKEIVDKLTLTAHIGKAKFKNYSASDYTVYRVGATYDFSGWLLGAYVKGTDANTATYTYLGKDWSKDRLVVSVARTF